jgi:hypothetical protein
VVVPIVSYSYKKEANTDQFDWRRLRLDSAVIISVDVNVDVFVVAVVVVVVVVAVEVAAKAFGRRSKRSMDLALHMSALRDALFPGECE